MAGNYKTHSIQGDRRPLFTEKIVLQKDDLAQLATEVTQLKQNLPKILNKKTIDAVAKIDHLEAEVAVLKRSKADADQELSQWKLRCEAAVADCQNEKQENLKLRREVQDLTQQLSQQSDFCSSLGSACCTLLWRVSRCEESIQSILVGTKVDEFLSLVSNTLGSYISAYKDDWPQEDNSEETQFILALCGIITNIAASAYGRDFMITNEHGRHVIDTYISALTDAPNGRSAKLKNLMIMALYNMSINQKGVKYISSSMGILNLLVWLLQDEKASENKVNTLRLIQSILCDESKVGAAQELQEMLPMPFLQCLCNDKHKEIQRLAKEILTDLRQSVRMEQ